MALGYLMWLQWNHGTFKKVAEEPESGNAVQMMEAGSRGRHLGTEGCWELFEAGRCLLLGSTPLTL